MSVERKAGALPTLRKAPTGIAGLDEILKGGLPACRPSLVCGGAGCGKTTLGMEFLVRGALEFGEPGFFMSFEESPEELIENFRGFGFDLEHLTRTKQLSISHVAIAKEEITENGDPWMRNGMLAIRAFRPGYRGLEEHLVSIAQEANTIRPLCVVLDPVTDFISAGGMDEVKSLLTRILDLLKRLNCTVLMTALSANSGLSEETDLHVSSLVDTWIALDVERTAFTSRRTLHVIKSRGMTHAADTREFLMSSEGLALRRLAPRQAISEVRA